MTSTAVAPLKPGSTPAALVRGEPTQLTDSVYQICINPDCRATFSVGEVLTGCTRCGALLDVSYDWDRVRPPASLREFEARWSSRTRPVDFSGVWRFRELLPILPGVSSTSAITGSTAGSSSSADRLVTIGEGQTLLQPACGLASFVGVAPDKLYLQYEGFNPSGSFKDNGMAAAFSHARLVGARVAACASTGNTSASLALYAAHSGMKSVVFVGSGRIAPGKLAQALDYGALTLQVAGNFDACMSLVRQAAPQAGLYLVNSVNPFRLEGQKTVMYRVLEALGWQVPDWIVVPGGNLGNSSAFGKAFDELHVLGLIPRKPRLAIINADGARTLSDLYNLRGLRWQDGRPDARVLEGYLTEMREGGWKPATTATAIEINHPVNLPKALRALDHLNGVVRAVTDEAILDAKAMVGRFGYGCEPASAASVAGARLLVQQGVIGRDERVVCVLTGHALKDTHVTIDYHTLSPAEFAETYGEYEITGTAYSNPPVVVPADIDAILARLG